MAGARKKAVKAEAEARTEESVKDVFWADQLAGEIIERAKKEGRIATCKSAASPSGAKHIGNLFDVMKAFFPYKSAVKKGGAARFIFTNDNMDPLRTIPDKLPDKAGRMQPTADFKEKFSKYLGMPYVDVPDPFDCCGSWSEHFNGVWLAGIYAMGVKENELKVFSNDMLYAEGKFDPYIELAFKGIDKTRAAYAPFHATMKPDYIPFHAICANCGKITTKVTAFDIASKTVKYACTGRALAGKYKIEGCGHAGEASWHEGKLPWKFEWPAAWGIFGVTFEPFGKEHAEGSWPAGQVIAREIYGFEPPIPHIYEFMLVNGKKMAARLGNVFIVQEILEVLEPEVLSFFYTKRSGKQRNFDVKNIHLLVNDFEKAERLYFGLEKEKNEEDFITLARQYESAASEVPAKAPKRIEYQFAAVVGQLAPDLATAIKMLRYSGHIGKDEKLSADDEGFIARRLSLGRNWARAFATENLLEVRDMVPADVKAKVKGKERDSLRELSELLKKDVGQDKLYNSFFEIAKNNGIEPKAFFRAVYLALLGKESGPRLAPFILALGKDRVRKILEQV
jgi:lysyl-tRNA synthetase class 1